ncbi:uncharacterized protein LOC130445542 [Diorhabda sublineata]|uniref:uncharacterized protein LOC130445542 n=1 Tax=Diorhabda sublineata TaxID=1163346 RepID=UPI0024E12B6B|nr:uncharacterized protein LOC130445542 [Diorhabda sublineata]
MYLDIIPLLIFLYLISIVNSTLNDICGGNNGKRFYLEPGESGTLVAEFKNNILLHNYDNNNNNNTLYNKCTVEFITCPSCIIDIQFRLLNISRNCGKASVFDTCGCDYIWIYEPPIDDASGEQFCGRYIKSNASNLTYSSQTRTVAFTFIYNNEYGHAFTLDYFAKKNVHIFEGTPKLGHMNNASQIITSPFFPHLYPVDLNVEYVVKCKSIEPCRISLLFTDFLVDASSIMEFFDWTGQRIYVISGNTFRPPVIISDGPSLVVRFYANGGSNLGFKATYSFILGNLQDSAFKPHIGCGGYVNNLGGGITMMDMVVEGTTYFDCVWIVKPPESFRHRKTHLYVKVDTFSDFAGTTELTIKQGVTSNQQSVEILRNPMARYGTSKQTEHVVPINQGFYIRLRGMFTPKSTLGITYAAFNYKDCFGNSEFLCRNMRCISMLLNCDGFDHCGDNSDELNCVRDAKDRREYSRIPNFLFPKIEPYSDMTTATFVFLTCSFGLIGIILAMALLLYRVNVKAQHQRQIQDHIETIHAILEEGVGEVEEEIIVPDEPPDYEPPPEYNDLVKLKSFKNFKSLRNLQKRCPNCNEYNKCGSISRDITNLIPGESLQSHASTSTTQTPSIPVPNSPPPAYEQLTTFTIEDEIDNVVIEDVIDEDVSSADRSFLSETTVYQLEENVPSISTDNRAKYFDNIPKISTQFLNEIKKGFRHCKSVNFLKSSRKTVSCSEENFGRYRSDSELIFNSRININYLTGANGFRYRKSYSSSALTSL